MPFSLPDDHSDYGSTVSGSTGKSPGPIFPAPSFTFPGQPPHGTVLTHKAAVYYHHQLSLQEDQGIDMTQVSVKNQAHNKLVELFPNYGRHKRIIILNNVKVLSNLFLFADEEPENMPHL